MRSDSSRGLHPQGGLLGILNSRLRIWSSHFWHFSDDLERQTGEPNTGPILPVRVLVVDDDRLSRLVISAMMESRGLAPLFASDGVEAVLIACELQLDLIVMDLQMPILDGLKATAAIRHFERTCTRPPVPVVAYSMSLPDTHLMAKHGMNGSLAKPCDEQELENCLVQWCPAYRCRPAAGGVSFEDSSQAAGGHGARGDSPR